MWWGRREDGSLPAWPRGALRFFGMRRYIYSCLNLLSIPIRNIFFLFVGPAAAARCSWFVLHHSHRAFFWAEFPRVFPKVDLETTYLLKIPFKYIWRRKVPHQTSPSAYTASPGQQKSRGQQKRRGNSAPCLSAVPKGKMKQKGK